MINYYNKVKNLTLTLQKNVTELYDRVLEKRQNRLEALNEASNSIPDLQDKIDRNGEDSFLEVRYLYFNDEVSFCTFIYL